MSRLKAIFSRFGAIAAECKKHGLSVLSSDPGSLSSRRLMMLTFATLAIILISCTFYHVLKMKDIAMAHEWLSALPSIFGGLTALCGIPYGISKAGSSISDLVSSLRKRD